MMVTVVAPGMKFVPVNVTETTVPTAPTLGDTPVNDGGNGPDGGSGPPVALLKNVTEEVPVPGTDVVRPLFALTQPGCDTSVTV
jgi:hypothetical protein